MALLLFDGFEQYPDSDKSLIESGNWGGFSNNLEHRNTGANARTGNCSLDFFNNGWLKTVNLGTPSTLIVGFGLYPQDESTSGTDHVLLDLRTGDGDIELRVTDPGGANAPWSADIAVGGTQVATLSHSFVMGDWAYVEVKVVVHPTNGSVEARVDGVTVASASGIDTQPGANGYIEEVHWFGDFVVFEFYLDDVYVCDGTGAAPFNDFLGPIRIHSLLPNADGDTTQFTPSAGTDHYALVDEDGRFSGQSYDGSDYNTSSTTLGEKELYQLEDLGATLNDPLAVQMFGRVRLDAAGTGALAPLIKSNVTESEGALTPLTASFRLLAGDLHTVDPDTGAAWTKAGVDALQAGMVVR